MAVVTNTVKKNNLGLVDPNNPNAPVQVQQPQQTMPDSNAVQGAANQSSMQINKMAQQGFTSPTIQATSQQTQQLLKDPTQGQNYQQNINTRLAQQDRERAQAVETARQGLAGMSGSSLNQNALVDIALKGAEQRADLQTQLESEAATAKQEAIYKALAEGRATSGTELDAYDTNINALKTAIGATDIERQGQVTAGIQAREQAFTASQADLNRAAQASLQAGDIQGQKDIAELQGKIQLGQQLQQQDFTAAQAALERAAQVALQKGDIEGQKAIEQLRGELALAAQKSTQAFTSQENQLNRLAQIALQSGDIQGQKDIAILQGKIQSGQQLQEQDFKAVQAALDRSQQTAIQRNDLNAVRDNLMTQLQFNKEEAATGRQFTAEQNSLNRLLETSLKNLDIESAKDLTTLKSKLDAGEALNARDWQGAQNQLDRLAAEALQKGDIQGQLQVQALKGEIDAAQQKSQQQWQTAERVSSQLYNTDERLSSQDYESFEKAKDRKLQESTQMQDYYNKLNLQSNEFNQQETMAKLQADIDNARADGDLVRAQKLGQFQNALQLGLQDDAQKAQRELAEYEASNQRYLQDQSAQLQLKLQTQGFDQEQKMAYLGAQLQNAKDVNDVNLQKQIMKYQSMLDFEARSQDAGNEQAMLRLKSELDTALQNNDFVHAEALQKARLDQEASIAAQDHLLDKARIALEAKQVDMQQIEQQYNQIADLVSQGILDPSAQYEFITKTLSAQGVDTSGYDMVNAEEAAKKALNHEFEMQKQQFMQTHPEVMQQSWEDGTGKAWTLKELQALGAGYTSEWANQNMKPLDQQITPEGQKALNEFINSAIYGELSEADKKARETAGYLKAEDIPAAQSGDKFAFEEPVSYNGQTIPAGKYTVTTSDVGHGNKFFGTAYTNTHTYLVDESGKKYEIDTSKSGTKGNIISGLWADS